MNVYWVEVTHFGIGAEPDEAGGDFYLAKDKEEARRLCEAGMDPELCKVEDVHTGTSPITSPSGYVAAAEMNRRSALRILEEEG